MHITRKHTYSALAGLGVLVGTAGIAGATSGGSTPVDQAQDPVATAIETDDGENDLVSYVSSITVESTGSEADEASQLAVLSTVSEADATAAALIAQSGTVTSAQLENEDGNVIYAVDIDTGSGAVEVKVDAGNASVLAIETGADAVEAADSESDNESEDDTEDDTEDGRDADDADDATDN